MGVDGWLGGRDECTGGDSVGREKRGVQAYFIAE